jgi:zinc protease
MMRNARRAALALLVALALPAGAARAQDHVVVLPEPGTPVVATEVLVAASAADEDPEQAGIASLAARSVTAPLRATLDSLGAHLAVDAHRDALSFTLTAAPDAWEEASRALLLALFRDPVDSTAVARERQAIAAELRGRQENPADAVVRALESATFGEAHPWARPAVGYPESVARLGAADVDRFLRANFTPERTVVAVVGPVDDRAVRAHLASLAPASGPLPFTPVARQPAEGTVRRDYNSVTTWIARSYPLPADADLAAIRLLAQMAIDQLSFSPSRRSVYNARVEVLPRLDGGELRFELVVPPEEVEEWAGRIEEVVETVEKSELTEGQLAARVRRYRGERLQALEAPEDRARELARQVLVYGHAGNLLPNLDDMTLERLRAAAESLGRPVTVFLGPLPNEEG